MVTGAHVVAEARRWIGTPWRHQGRTRHGIDCAGLAVVTGRALRLTAHDSTDYQPRAHGLHMIEHFRAAGCAELPIDRWDDGDILVLRDDAYPCHVAVASTVVVAGEAIPSIIHAHASRRRVVEEALTPDLVARVLFRFRLPGVTP